MKWNLPVASHISGVWERQICSAWTILFLTKSPCWHWLLRQKEYLIQDLSQWKRSVILLANYHFTSKHSYYEIQGSHASTRQIFKARFILSKKMETYPACNEWVLVALEKRVSSVTSRKKEVARQKVKFSKWRYCTTSRWWFDSK